MVRIKELDIIRWILIIFMLGMIPCVGAEYNYNPIKDELVEKTLKNVSNVYPESNLDYDYTNINFIPVKLRFTEMITTKRRDLHIGGTVEFETVEDVFDGEKKIVAKNTKGTAKIDFFEPRGTMGSAGEIIISDFDIANLDKKKFESNIIKKGLDLSFITSVLRHSVGIIIPGSGFLFILIRGGHAKIKPKEIFELKYVP